MNEKPILFSGPMVRAILEGTKTQIRRVMKFKFPPNWNNIQVEYISKYTALVTYRAFPGGRIARWEMCSCPYGNHGDRLWVRETFAINKSYDSLKVRTAYEAMAGDVSGCVAYAAESETKNWRGKWRPSIFMPRWASRITLEITNVRVQKLREIDEKGARAEGCRTDETGFVKEHFADLWDSINAKRGLGWETNP